MAFSVKRFLVGVGMMALLSAGCQPTAAPAGAPTEQAAAPTISAPTATTAATAPPPATSTPRPTTAALAATNTPLPTPPSPTATATQVAMMGRTAEGAFFIGREDAPLTITDYSDFM